MIGLFGWPILRNPVRSTEAQRLFRGSEVGETDLMNSRTETISSPSGAMGVHIVRPEGDGPFPVVVFFHHGPGLDEGSKQTMARIAEWGYYVVSPDRYHRAESWYTMKSRDGEEMAKMFGYIMSTSEADIDEDLGALLEWLPSDPAAGTGAMGCVGYCIGARSVVCTISSRGDLFRAGVGLHPSFCTTDDADSPHLGVPAYTGSLYIGFGSADAMQPASANMPLIDATNALAKGEAEIHDGADHGFAVFGHAYHEAAADRSYERAKAMFDRELKG
jgi:carboxymethylenebutenolidase